MEEAQDAVLQIPYHLQYLGNTANPWIVWCNGSNIYASSINITYDTTSYAEFDMMYGMGTGSMDVASLTNKAMTLSF